MRGEASLCTHQLQLCPLAVEEKSCHEEGKQSEDGRGSALQPLVVEEIDPDQEEVNNDSSERKKNTVHFPSG